MRRTLRVIYPMAPVAADIGLALLLISVPLTLSITVLVSLSTSPTYRFIVATVSGVVAVLTTLVTEGTTEMLVVLAVVLVVSAGALLAELLAPSSRSHWSRSRTGWRLTCALDGAPPVPPQQHAQPRRHRNPQLVRSGVDPRGRAVVYAWWS